MTGGARAVTPTGNERSSAPSEPDVGDRVPWTGVPQSRFSYRPPADGPSPAAALVLATPSSGCNGATVTAPLAAVLAADGCAVLIAAAGWVGWPGVDAADAVLDNAASASAPDRATAAPAAASPVSQFTVNTFVVLPLRVI